MKRCFRFGPPVWANRLSESMVSLSVHVSGALRLRCSGAEILPAEGGEQHGSRQVHGRQVVGPGGEAGLRQSRLVPDDSQDVQGLVP